MQKKHSVIYSWIFSYVLMLVLIIVSGFVMEKLAIRKLIEEYKDITDTLQEQANESIQSYFDKMKNRAIEICSDSGVVSYALSSQPDGANYHTLILLQERLLNQMLTVQDEIALYLYLGNIDKAISAYTIYDNAAFERELGNFCELSQDEYRELLNRKYLNSVLALDAGDAGGKTVAMLTGVPMAGAGEKAKGMFIQILDNQVLKNILESGTVIADSTMILVDEKGEILCSNGDDELISAFVSAGVQQNKEAEIEIEGKAYWIAGESLNVENWKLITLLPMSSIVAKTDWVPKTIVPILCAALFFGVLVAVRGVYVNYIPLRRLSRAFPVGNHETSLKNEFEQLRFALQDMHTELESIQILQNAQAEQLKLEFLRFCLENSIDLDESSLLKIIESLGVKIHNGYFLTAIFDVSIEDAELPLSVNDIADVFGQLFSGREFAEYGSCSILVKNELPVMLFYLKDGEGKAEIIERFKEKLHFLSGQYRWEVIYAFSSPHKGFSEIHLAWLEACELLDYKYFKFGRKNRELSDDTGMPEHGQLRYSLVQEELLVRYVLAGNKADAKDLLHLIYDNNFQEQRISLPVAWCLMEDIVIGMMKALSGENCLSDSALERINHTLDMLRKTNGREALMKLVDDLAGELSDECAKSRKRDRAEKGFAVEKITDCVEEHYRECDFNVSKAAEYLDMNVAYLSRYFKEHTGIGLLNYINGVRIDYAKQLMGQQNITVAEAAKAAGFENQNTFIRLFKKFEGRTPGLFLEKD